MPRRRREHRRFAPLPTRRVETGADGFDYEVRVVNASRAVKVYRCPGCDHEIRVGTTHVVVLPIDVGDVDDRRHWHTACWTNRANRGPTRRWS
ncbi:hypothetical protein [Mycolicibacterium houstonense]|uniref:hypothetical protein n=1 Tax=Mycolicibacterium houstonense TaxID=146021 RepID=UPI000834D94C|nr:hypothetical protein [Mycolicibacterium houstonense]